MRWLCARPDPGRTRRGGALPPSSRRSAQPRATDRDTCTGAVPPGPGETRRERGPAPSQTARHSRQRHGRVIRRTARAGRNPVGRGPALSLPLLARARHCRQRYGRDTRIRRCAARAGRDPAGRDPAPSLSLLGTADSVMAATHAQGGARPEPGETRRGRDPAPSLSLLGTADSEGGARPKPGETRRGGTLLPPSRCSAQPTASWPRHTRKAVRGPSWA